MTENIILNLIEPHKVINLRQQHIRAVNGCTVYPIHKLIYVRLLTDRLAFKVYQSLACVSPYPVISPPYQCIYLCFCMSNTKLPDFPKATSALVNNGNTDRA